MYKVIIEKRDGNKILLSNVSGIEYNIIVDSFKKMKVFHHIFEDGDEAHFNPKYIAIISLMRVNEE